MNKKTKEKDEFFQSSKFDVKFEDYESFNDLVISISKLQYSNLGWKNISIIFEDPVGFNLSQKLTHCLGKPFNFSIQKCDSKGEIYESYKILSVIKSIDMGHFYKITNSFGFDYDCTNNIRVEIKIGKIEIKKEK